MFNIGFPELLLILVIGFIVFGPKHLPRLGRTVGRLIGEWRKLSRDLEKTIDAVTSATEVAATTIEDSTDADTPAAARRPTPDETPPTLPS